MTTATARNAAVPPSGVTPTPNPVIQDVRLDGAPVAGDATTPPFDLALVLEHQLEVKADQPAATLSYAWFTALGTLKHYRSPSAVLTVAPEQAGDGGFAI